MTPQPMTPEETVEQEKNMTPSDVLCKESVTDSTSGHRIDHGGLARFVGWSITKGSATAVEGCFSWILISPSGDVISSATCRSEEHAWELMADHLPDFFTDPSAHCELFLHMKRSTLHVELNTGTGEKWRASYDQGYHADVAEGSTQCEALANLALKYISHETQEGRE